MEMVTITKSDIDPKMEEHFKKLGYYPIRIINGEVVSIARFLFTWGLMVGINKKGYHRTRFCYPNVFEAVKAFVEWEEGEGDPPGPWIKQKPEERVGPNSPIKFIE